MTKKKKKKNDRERRGQRICSLWAKQLIMRDIKDKATIEAGGYYINNQDRKYDTT